MSKAQEQKVRYIKEELLMARKLNEEYLQTQMREAIDRYTGVFVPAIGLSWDIMLNEVYPIIQYNLPSIFFRDPRSSFGVGRQKTSKTSTKRQRLDCL